MKNIFFVALTIIVSSATTFAQSKVSKEVETAFYSKFPKATKVKWDKENAHEYEANFTDNRIEYSANFSVDGKWLETESPENFENLPSNIKTAFNNSHQRAKVKAVSKIETSNKGTQYEIEVKKRLKTVEYLYNLEGQLIK